MKECHNLKSHISSNLRTIYISSNNVRHPVTKTFITLHPTTLHSTSLHLLTFHFTFLNFWGNCHCGAPDSSVFAECQIWPYSYQNIIACLFEIIISCFPTKCLCLPSDIFSWDFPPKIRHSVVVVVGFFFGGGGSCNLCPCLIVQTLLWLY